MNLFLAAADLGSEAPKLHGIGVFNYWLVIALMMTGLFLILSKSNMVKTIIGLNFFQVSVIMFYVSMGKVDHGTAPILYGDDIPSHEEDHGSHDAEHGQLMPLQDLEHDVFLCKTKWNLLLCSGQWLMHLLPI